MSRKNWLNTFKRITLLSACLCLTFAFSACSGSPKKENEIAEEIASCDSYFQNYNLELTNFTITKRQTNKDDKNDLIWITLAATNEEFEYTASYCAVYILYNDGWLLESFNIIHSSYSATAEFNRSGLEYSLSKEYATCEYISSSQHGNTVNLNYTVSTEDHGITETFDLSISMEFSPETSWKESTRTLKSISKEYDPMRAAQCYLADGNYSFAKNAILHKEGTLATEDIALLNEIYEMLILEQYQKFVNDPYGIYSFLLDDILNDINQMPYKTSSIDAIESEINEFLGLYGKWIGYYGTLEKNIGSHTYDKQYFVEIYAIWDKDSEHITLAVNDNKWTNRDLIVTEDSISYDHIINDTRTIEYVSDTEIKYSFGEYGRSLYKYYMWD